MLRLEWLASSGQGCFKVRISKWAVNRRDGGREREISRPRQQGGWCFYSLRGGMGGRKREVDGGGGSEGHSWRWWMAKNCMKPWARKLFICSFTLLQELAVKVVSRESCLHQEEFSIIGADSSSYPHFHVYEISLTNFYYRPDILLFFNASSGLYVCSNHTAFLRINVVLQPSLSHWNQITEHELEPVDPSTLPGIKIVSLWDTQPQFPLKVSAKSGATNCTDPRLEVFLKHRGGRSQNHMGTNTSPWGHASHIKNDLNGSLTTVSYFHFNYEFLFDHLFLKISILKPV